AELEALRRLIIDKTEGNPFFIEELVQSLLEQKVLRRNGGLHLARPLDNLKVPTTVQAILASRIDHLPPPEKELIQTLAVLGKDFRHTLVNHVAAAPEPDLDRMLLELEAGEFIYEKPPSAERCYTFKHALTQEVAYDSMLLERRRRLHSKA